MKFFTSFLFIISILAAGCAIQSYPTGGKPDDTPPTVKRSNPENQIRNSSKKEIVLHFDSYPKAGVSYGKEVFISPLLAKPPKIFIMDKSLHIKFEEDLKENTTYVITVSDISDHFTSQKMTTPYIYAFSTGEVLDSMKVTGTVVSGMTGTAEKDFRVLLFDADSVKNNADIFGKRPEYLSKTDDNGAFILSNVKKKAYKIFAIKDADQSNSYNQKTELIALDSSASVVFPDSASTVSKHLISFLPDEQAPKVKGYDWAGEDGLVVEVSETILTDSLKIVVSDTLGNDKQAITEKYFFSKDKKQVYFLSPRTRKSISQITFLNLTDSLHNHADTTFRVYEKSLMTSKEAPFYQRPSYNFDTQQFEWLWGAKMTDSLANFIALSDSSKKNYPILLAQKGLKGTMKMTAVPKNLKEKLILNFDGKLFGLEDSTIRIPLQYPDSTLFGRVSGKLITEGYEGKIVWILSSGGGGKDKNASSSGTKIILYNRDFNLKNLPTGNYSVKVIFDTDGNGTWTPGSLQTNRLPERILTIKEPLNVKANWDLDKLELFAPYDNKINNKEKSGEKGKVSTNPTNEKTSGKK